jgi:hypothetical protein
MIMIGFTCEKQSAKLLYGTISWILDSKSALFKVNLLAEYYGEKSSIFFFN